MCPGMGSGTGGAAGEIRGQERREIEDEECAHGKDKTWIATVVT